MSLRITQAIHGNMRTCPVCKKEFTYFEGWVYRRTSGCHEKVFCTWRCLRQWEKNHRSPIERREMIQQAIRDGFSDNEIAEMLDEDKTKVTYWRKKYNAEKAVNTDEHETGYAYPIIAD